MFVWHSAACYILNCRWIRHQRQRTYWYCDSRTRQWVLHASETVSLTMCSAHTIEEKVSKCSTHLRGTPARLRVRVRLPQCARVCMYVRVCARA